MADKKDKAEATAAATQDSEDRGFTGVTFAPPKDEGVDAKKKAPAAEAVEFKPLEDNAAIQKKKPEAGPEFKQNPSDDNAAVKPKAEEKKPEDNAAVPPKKEEPKSEIEKEREAEASQFVPSISKSKMQVINEAWGLPDVDIALKQALENASVKKKGDGLVIGLPNGHKIQWDPNMPGTNGEFIGIVGYRPNLDELDAKTIIAAAKSRGKESVNLHGSRSNKEKLWLEAMRQDVKVANFQPMPDSKVYQQWMKEKESYLAGVSAAPGEPPEQEAKVEQPKADAPKAEEPKAEAKAEEPKAEAKAETPKVEEPKADAKAEAPKAEEPKADVKAEAPKAEEPKAKAETPKVEEPKAEAKAETPKVEEPKADVKSAFVKPAEAEAKADAPKADDKAEAKAEAPKTDAKGAAASSFVDTGKKDKPPAPKAPAVKSEQTFEEVLDRRIKEAKNPEVRSTLEKIRSEYKSGNLKLDDIGKDLVKAKIGGTKPLTPASLNKAVGFIASKPENKGIELPQVKETTPGGPQQNARKPKALGNG
jgi:hypothetical protein